MPKNADIYSCEICGFKCSKKSNYRTHLLTGKHKIRTLTNKKMPECSPIFECLFCNKLFKHASSLWNHTNKCHQNEESMPTHLQKECESEDTNMMSMFHEMMRENKELRELLMDQSKQAQEAHSNTQLEIQKQILDLASEGTIVNNTINNNNTNKFNLNFFLNEQCKNAMDLTVFLNSIVVQVDDVTNMGRLGFAEGISRIILNALKELDVYERPIHCSDIKREMMYIKDNGIWEKDSNMKDHMKRAIKCISFKNIRKLSDWRDANPGWSVLHSQLEEDYLHITSESMGGSSTEEDEKLYNKIIRKLANEVVIDKNMI